MRNTVCVQEAETEQEREASMLVGRVKKVMPTCIKIIGLGCPRGGRSWLQKPEEVVWVPYHTDQQCTQRNMS